jgi:hypothetical protein
MPRGGKQGNQNAAWPHSHSAVAISTFKPKANKPKLIKQLRPVKSMKTLQPLKTILFKGK